MPGPQQDKALLRTRLLKARSARDPDDRREAGRLIRDALLSIDPTATPAQAPAEKPVPAVAIKKSVTPDYIVCLEDGAKVILLKRHLSAKYNMTPRDYRDRWGLPHDYPMVAPNYAAARSQLAKQMGLGQQRRRRK